MLTISKPLSAGQAQSYHQKEFTAKEQNYWSQQGAIAGQWQGRLALQFGLAGAVTADVALQLNRIFRTFGAVSNKKLELTYSSQQLGCSSGKAERLIA
jgi:hypothetical protein